MNNKITILEDDDYALEDDLPAELPLDAMSPDVERTRRFRARALQGMVRLAPDVAEVFDSAEAVNEVLRTMIRVMKASQSESKVA